MSDIAIFLEGQNGLNWENWKRIGRSVEDLGFAGLYRSDHFTNMRPPDKDSLELWISGRQHEPNRVWPIGFAGVV